MRGTITIECDECIDDITIDVSTEDGIKLPLKSEIRSELIKAGWHASRRILCPTCYAKADKRRQCRFCSSWHNSGGYSPWCERDTDIAVQDDTCKHFSSTKSE